MSRLSETFAHKPVFMPYFPVGYPDYKTSIDILEALAKNGADIIEVGISFSDPLADGPVIQHATQIALEKGITLRKSLDAVHELRRRGVDIPLILMGYYNPILAFGLEDFIREAGLAGVDGFIIPDLPLEEAAEFTAQSGDLPLIPMLAPTTTDERMEAVLKEAQGFIYLVSVTGVTGARTTLSESLVPLIGRVRRHSTLPVCVGFGISTPEQAGKIGQIADGAIVGSALVRAIEASSDPVRKATEFARAFDL